MILNAFALVVYFVITQILKLKRGSLWGEWSPLVLWKESEKSLGSVWPDRGFAIAFITLPLLIWVVVLVSLIVGMLTGAVLGI